MTTTILVTIGILVAAAAALMTVFYGGEAFYNSRVNAEASRLVVEGAQLERAVGAFVAQEGRRPGDGVTPALMQQELVSKRYLREVPAGARQPWVIDYDNKMIHSDLGAVENEEARKVCLAARRQLDLPNPDRMYRCDGSDYPGGVLPSRESCCIY